MCQRRATQILRDEGVRLQKLLKTLGIILWLFFFVPQNVYEWIDMLKYNRTSVADKLRSEHPSILTVEGNFINEFGTQILSNRRMANIKVTVESLLVLFAESFNTLCCHERWKEGFRTSHRTALTQLSGGKLWIHRYALESKWCIEHILSSFLSTRSSYLG
jgi:hypothetical protein